jgi:hypothetical protein
MPRQFAAAQIDEVELRLAAAALARSGGPGLPTTEELRRLGAARGVDMATAFFYEAVMRHPVHGAFARGIDARPALPCAEPSAVKVLVIPAWLYREHPEWGADGRLVKSVAGACGLACEVAETRSKGGVPENAEVVIDVLRRESCRDVWIVSYSKSVLEVRYAMEKYAADPALARSEAGLRSARTWGARGWSTWSSRSPCAAPARACWRG